MARDPLHMQVKGYCTLYVTVSKLSNQAKFNRHRCIAVVIDLFTIGCDDTDVIERQSVETIVHDRL